MILVDSGISKWKRPRVIMFRYDGSVMLLLLTRVYRS